MQHTSRSKKAGLPPGSIVYTGENPEHEVSISIIYYNESVFHKEVYSSKEDFKIDFQFSGNIWINIDGINDIALIQKMGAEFDIDSLILEDLVNPEQRVKLEEREEYLFLILKTLNLNLITEEIEYEQLSFILQDNILITVQETPKDFFDTIRYRLEADRSKGRIRSRSIGYLAYTLIDTLVDNYFVILDEVEKEIDGVEAKVIDKSEKEDLEIILDLKQSLSHLKRFITPLRELVAKLQTRGMREYFEEDMRIYLNDLYDHSIIIFENIEMLNSRVNELVQLYHSTVSNDMNQIMKILAVISTIFMPLSFLTGLYGMNFRNMPELETHLGYFILLGFMVLLVFGMLLFFKKKKWL